MMERKQKEIQISPALLKVLKEWVRNRDAMKQTGVDAGVPWLFPHLPSQRVAVPALSGSTLRTLTWGDIAHQLGHQVTHTPDPRTLATAVSEQPMAPPLLQALTNHPDYMVRWSVVLNPTVPASLLATLAGDSVEFIRREVARHALTPPEVLHQLSQDPVLGVRYAVAANPHTGWNTLKGMVYSKSQRIVRAIANHPNTPADHPLKQLNEM
ncbi:MAG: HEAT repeat domain-containing protein [Nitrospira sp.]|nr:HEAT repeat domain-containing protein [Nitrospira sp.]